MSGAAPTYTLVLAEDRPDGGPVRDYIVTDAGVLFATHDNGVSWRCYGLVDPETFLADLILAESGLPTEADEAWSRQAHRRHVAA
jgi:hypothetical protein